MGGETNSGGGAEKAGYVRLEIGELGEAKMKRSRDEQARRRLAGGETRSQGAQEARSWRDEEKCR